MVQKKVIQYDKSGVVMNEFDGIKLAARELDICPATIRKSLNGTELPRTNFYFKYK